MTNGSKSQWLKTMNSLVFLTLLLVHHWLAGGSLFTVVSPNSQYFASSVTLPVVNEKTTGFEAGN